MRSTMVSGRGDRISLALILSYFFDWAIIIVAAVIGYIFGARPPNKRPFSLADPDISFPYTVSETISSALLFIVALVAPAVIILFVALVLVPGPTVPKSTAKSLIWMRKLWEWFTGWTGLALSCATTWLITNGMKNLFGHWRPDLLARCNPDVANISKYAVGGIPNTAQGTYLVSWYICQTTDTGILDDGFRSFPSGHASLSAAGLIYLSLFLASKLAITIPYLAPRPYSNEPSYYSAFPSRMDRARHAARGNNNSADSTYNKGDVIEMGTLPPLHGHGHETIAARNQAAAPPIYLLLFVAIPFLTSIYITSTRYSEFRHHGLDLLFGYFIGTAMAIFSFRFYHLPISHSAGWAWGPRSRDRAFWAGIGVGSYATNRVDSILSSSQEPMKGNLEAGPSTRAVIDHGLMGDLDTVEV